MQTTRPQDSLCELEREEEVLAQRAMAGDRAAFDQLFDRYYARMATQFRNLPGAEYQRAMWDALEQLFAGLATEDEPLPERAFRIYRSTRERTLSTRGES